jgi:hypothetical protein
LQNIAPNSSRNAAALLGRLYATKSTNNGVTNEYFRTNYIRSAAWKQLHQWFDFDIGEVGELIWQRWNNECSSRTEIGTWSEDIKKLVKHFDNLRNSKPVVDGNKFLTNIKHIRFECNNPEHGPMKMADFRHQITEVFSTASDYHDIDKVTAENLVLQRITANRENIDLVNKIKAGLSDIALQAHSAMHTKLDRVWRSMTQSSSSPEAKIIQSSMYSSNIMYINPDNTRLDITC